MRSLSLRRVWSSPLLLCASARSPPPPPPPPRAFRTIVVVVTRGRKRRPAQLERWWWWSLIPREDSHPIKKNSKSQNIPLFSLDVKYVGWRKSTHTRTHTKKKKTHRQTLNPNKKSPFGFCRLSSPSSSRFVFSSSRALFFGPTSAREREKEKEKRGFIRRRRKRRRICSARRRRRRKESPRYICAAR